MLGLSRYRLFRLYQAIGCVTLTVTELISVGCLIRSICLTIKRKNSNSTWQNDPTVITTDTLLLIIRGKKGMLLVNNRQNGMTNVGG